VLFLSSFFKLLPLVLEAGAGEEEADCDAGAFVCGFLISLSSSLRPFPCYPLSFSVSLSLYILGCPCVCLFGGEGGATGVAASTGLEEDDDEGAVAGQNLLSPLYNLRFLFFSCLGLASPRFCDSLFSAVRGSVFVSPSQPLSFALFLPFVALFLSLTSSVSLRRNRGTKVCLFSPLSRFCDHQWLFSYAPSLFLSSPWFFRVPPWFFSCPSSVFLSCSRSLCLLRLFFRPSVPRSCLCFYLLLMPSFSPCSGSPFLLVFPLFSRSQFFFFFACMAFL